MGVEIKFKKMNLKSLNKNFLSKLRVVAFSAFSFLLFAPVMVFAQGGQVESGLQMGGLRRLFGIGSGPSGATSLSNIILRIIQMLLTFAAGAAILFVIIGGYQYITSHGNEEQSEAGKKTLINAIIGIVLIVMSYAIITVVVNTVSRGGGIFGIF